jgi:NCAIR mutase (PurE)-related protein
VNPTALRALLASVGDGSVAPDVAEARLLAALREAPYENLGFARIDHHRSHRQGMPEVVFGEGKTPEQIAEIARRIVDRGHNLLVTRASPAAFDAVRASVPGAIFHDTARTIVQILTAPPPGRGTVVVVCAGTSDLPVAEEAAVSAAALGNPVERIYDVGIAGLHRLLDVHSQLEAARVVIVVAGMEGALPSVVGGLVAVPVVAVPTSVGYGASFGGLAALLAMLNSCASGVAVVNIDNGFGAAAVANRINQLAGRQGD